MLEQVQYDMYESLLGAIVCRRNEKPPRRGSTDELERYWESQVGEFAFTTQGCDIVSVEGRPDTVIDFN